MHIAGENENVPSWVAHWPHWCDFGRYSCDVLRWAAMVLNASKSQENTHFHCIVWPGLISCCLAAFSQHWVRKDVKIPTYKPHTNHKRSSVRSHTLAPTTICDLSHSLCWRPLTVLGHISSVTYVCHPLWFVCGHRKGILMSPLSVDTKMQLRFLVEYRF